MAGGRTVTIYHNPRCSKSRQTLEILAGRGIEPVIVEYLKTPPTKDELRAILKKLGIGAEQLVRKGEDVYKTKFAGRALTDEQWLDALAKNPILIERPIVVKGDRAVVGRPPQNVLALL
ncbi:MAG TPA: arsenate reductase (glutaredoxin) [Burkholderiales bacterium]|nr:arsenate reductase (glutaredoxin) [Burkholderiales bacterium]